MQLALEAYSEVNDLKFSAIAREFSLLNRWTLNRRFFVTTRAYTGLRLRISYTQLVVVEQ